MKKGNVCNYHYALFLAFVLDHKPQSLHLDKTDRTHHPSSQMAVLVALQAYRMTHLENLVMAILILMQTDLLQQQTSVEAGQKWQCRPQAANWTCRITDDYNSPPPSFHLYLLLLHLQTDTQAFWHRIITGVMYFCSN